MDGGGVGGSGGITSIGRIVGGSGRIGGRIGGGSGRIGGGIVVIVGGHIVIVGGIVGGTIVIGGIGGGIDDRSVFLPPPRCPRARLFDPGGTKTDASTLRSLVASAQISSAIALEFGLSFKV